MNLSININLDNAAFQESHGIELSQILKRLGDKLGKGTTQPDSGKIMDLNGNTVGAWEITK